MNHPMATRSDEPGFSGNNFSNGTIRPTRQFIAAFRTNLAHEALENCHFCAHHCGVNRLRGEQGLCHAGEEARVFAAQTEVADELELIPTFAIAFSGCDLRCAFCLTGKESWNPKAGELFDAKALAQRATAALGQGAKTIMILGGEPTIHLPQVLELVSHLPNSAKLIWKTNAHGSTEARQLLDGMFDVWLADYKFGNDGCAERLARIANYTEIVRENLLWVGERSELLVRHLIMPGHVECCWEPVAEWLAENLPQVKASLRRGFWPGWQSSRHAELRGLVTRKETELAFGIAQKYKLHLVE